jgi:hypothetical protein
MDQQQYRTLDKFDRALAALDGVPGVVRTSPSTIRAVMPIVGDTSTFIVQTFRQRDEDKSGDTIFIEHVDANGTTRIVIPPNVANVILRQHDSLTDRARSAGTKAAAADRKARGILPGFMKNKGKKR